MKKTKKTLYIESKAHKISKWLLIGTLLVTALFLMGCAKEVNPITEINNGIQQSVNDLVDYAYNNMEMDTDKQFLIQGAKDCAARADAMTSTYNVSMEKCATEKSKLKLERNGLGIILLVLVGFIIYKPIRKFLHL